MKYSILILIGSLLASSGAQGSTNESNLNRMMDEIKSLADLTYSNGKFNYDLSKSLDSGEVRIVDSKGLPATNKFVGNLDGLAAAAVAQTNKLKITFEAALASINGSTKGQESNSAESNSAESNSAESSGETTGTSQEENEEMAALATAMDNHDQAVALNEAAAMRCGTREMDRLMECETQHIIKCAVQEKACRDAIGINLGQYFYEEDRCDQQHRFCLEGSNPRGNAPGDPYSIRQACEAVASENRRIGYEAIDNCPLYSNMDDYDLLVYEQCLADVCN